MSNTQGFKVGDEVVFGAKTGEKSRAVITKLNAKRAKVSLLERRGTNGQYPIGSVWTVSYGVLKLATVSKAVAKQRKRMSALEAAVSAFSTKPDVDNYNKVAQRLLEAGEDL